MKGFLLFPAKVILLRSALGLMHLLFFIIGTLSPIFPCRHDLPPFLLLDHSSNVTSPDKLL